MEDVPGESELLEAVESLTWYHSIDLGQGVVTPGIYDHRKYLDHYGLPKDLTGKATLDVGAASGFFSFEMERRGAEVTATDLPTWSAHDFGPLYQPDLDPEEADRYLHDPFLFAHKVLDSRVKRKLINVYDIGPETTGRFDMVFCGSVLIHLTDPNKALWCIRSVTRLAAIIATSIYPDEHREPMALFLGHNRGDGWWLPNRTALEAMIKSAGFAGWEWYSEFRLDHRNGDPGPYHGVVRAWNTPERPAILDETDIPRQPDMLERVSKRVERAVGPHRRRAGRWIKGR